MAGSVQLPQVNALIWGDPCPLSRPQRIEKYLQPSEDKLINREVVTQHSEHRALRATGQCDVEMPLKVHGRYAPHLGH